MASRRRTARLAGHVAPLSLVNDIGSCGSCNTPRCKPDAKRNAKRDAWATTAVPPLPQQPLDPSACQAKSEYDWRAVHDDLENGIFSGSYGWDHAAYWGIAEMKAGVDLKEWYKTRTEAEFYLPEYKELIDNPETQKDWDHIVTFDPMGMYSHPPTIAACQARLDIPELKDLEVDGTIVLPSKEIVTSKCAVSYAWNIPKLAGRLDLTEDELRQALHKYSHDPRLLDPNVRTYIPAVGGCTIYIFGDPRKLRDEKTETTVRVHDECIGSDVFGSDICSCRPYLIFALRESIKCAQRGGVGVVVYFRKEGRSLGEVIKFRVYNARINQEGGDRAEKYFHHTEAIAGIRDARFQTMMPDALNWLGLRRIDYLCSMSNEKYEAITGAGILVMQRVDLPEDYVKESMKVELEAKIASGYHSDAIDSDQISGDLLQLSAIRRQCSKLYELGKKGELSYFTIDESKLPLAVDATAKELRSRYPDVSKVPFHSRLRHFDQQELGSLLSSWTCDPVEKARRLVDLVVVSVLLDAGAGPAWKYISDGVEKRSSEGLAAASWDLFMEGFFSTDLAMKTRVNSLALKNITDEMLAKGLQVSRSNPLIGTAGRAKLLRNLGEALEAQPMFFGGEVARPGNLVDYVLSFANEKSCVGLEPLWRVLSDGLNSIWPLQANGMIRGDVWQHTLLKTDTPGSDLVPFHKLTQWLTYSVVDAMQHVLSDRSFRVEGLEMLTGLPEYRNGGLFIDCGALVPKDKIWLSQEVNVGTELVVEWRALTVVMIDKVAEMLRKKLGPAANDLPLAAVLEGGTWHAGRSMARAKRNDGSSPIRIRLDGTVF